MAQKKKARLRERRTNVADKIIAAALTASTILSPISAAATELTVHSKYSGVTNVSGSNGKYTVTTSKKSADGKSAFNRFSKFKLDPGHVANMILPSGTSKLYNFVDGPDKIDIQGTVNALKAEAKKLGGHLIFISPNGMIIGENGAINAGKFSAIIADDTTYKAIADDSSPWAQTEFKRMEAGYVALNPEGSIVVKKGGRITAPDGITLKAAQIQTEAGSKLDTKTRDFNSLVNVDSLDLEYFDTAKDSDNKYKNLRLTRSDDGDIRLESLAINGKEASIDHAGAIDAYGSVVMRARASGSSKYSAEDDMNGKLPFSSSDVSFKTTASAKVAVRKGASVKAANDIVVSADAWNYRADSTFGQMYSNIFKEVFDDFSGGDFDGSYTDLRSTADISIEQDATLAAGKDLTLHAGSLVGVEAGTSLGFMQLLKWNWSNYIPAASVIVSKQNGLATVMVSGDLSSGGDMSIEARSKLATQLNATAQVKNLSMTSPYTVAVLWADLDNNASVTIADTATVNAGGALSIASNVYNDITTNAYSVILGKSPGSTAINATFVTTDAETSVNADLVAGGNVELVASNDTYQWSVTAENRSSVEMRFAEQVEYNLSQPAFKTIYGKLADKVNLPESLRFGNGAGEGDYDGSKWGFAVLYTGVDFFNGSAPSQKATVKVAPSVKIVSSGDITIASDALVGDHNWTAQSTVGGSNFTSKDVGGSYTFAITYDRARLFSSVDIGASADLLAGGKLDIESSARVEWNRVSRVISKLRQDWESLKDYATGAETRKAWEEAYQYLKDDLYHDADLSNWQGFKNYSTAIGKYIAGALEYFELVSPGISLITDSMLFLDFASYANAYSKTYAITNNQQDKDVVSGGGSFVWPDWNVQNAVNIASGAHLSSASGDLSVRGVSASDLAVIGGWNAGLLGGVISINEGNGVGGTILFSEFDTQNDVNVHKGAKLESSKNLSLTTEDSSMQLHVNLSAAMAGKWGFQGQVNVLDASISGRVRADDEATLSGVSVDIQSEAENYATNVAVAIETADDKALGFSVAIDALAYENVARVADFDAAFSDDATPVSGAYIAADALSVGAFGHSHVNTVAVAGAATWKSEPTDEKAWYEYITDISKSIKGKFADIGQWIDGKIGSIGGVANEGAGLINEGAGDIEMANLGVDNNDLDDLNGGGGQQGKLNLDVAGSVAWNFADYVAHAGLEGRSGAPLSIRGYSDSGKNRLIAIESQADKWQAAFVGAAALALSDYSDANKKSVGIAGTLAVNSGSSVVSSDFGNATVASLNAGNASKDVISLSAGSTGRSVAGALGLAVTTGSETSGLTLAADVSVNLLDSSAKSTVSGVSFDTSATAQPLSTDLDILSYAKDTQVTGGIELALGKASKAVGASVQVSVIKNDLASTIENSKLNNLGAVSVDSYLGVTQVAAGITVAAGIGSSENAWAYSGAFVVDVLTDNAAASIRSSDLTASGSLHIAAGDGAELSERIKQHQASASFDLEVARTGASIDKVVNSSDYYSGAELETEDYYKKFTEGSSSAGKTTKVDDALTGHTGMVVVAAALAGSGTGEGKAAGTAAVVNVLSSSFDVDIENSTIKTAALDANSENGAAVVSLAAGAAVGSNGWGIDGSVVWNSIDNTANTTVRNADITITGTGASSLTAQNRALAVGVAGAVGLSTGSFAAGVSLGYQHITNDAVISVSGGANSTLSGAGGSLSANAYDQANSWLVALAVPVSTQGAAVGGNIALHRITGETSSVFDGLTVSGFGNMDITADEHSSAKTLSGAVSVSTESVSVAGAFTYTQIGVVRSEDQAQSLHAALKDSAVTMSGGGKLNVSTSDDANIVSIALGGGYGNTFSAGGAISVNQLHRRGLAEIAGSSVDGTGTAVTMNGAMDTDLTNVGLVIDFSDTGAGEGAIIVNRIGDENLVNVSGTGKQLNIGSLYALGASDTELINVELGGAGGGTGAGAGMVLVNSMSPTTSVTIEGVSITAADSLGAIAMSDTELRNYAGQGAGAGTGAGAGVIEVNYMNDETSTLVKNAVLNVKGKGNVRVSHDIADVYIDNSKMAEYLPDTTKDNQNSDEYVNSLPGSSAVYDNAFQGLFDKNTLRTERVSEDLQGLVIDASSTHVLTNAALVGAGSGGGAGAISINVDVLTGSTSAQALDSDLSSSSDVSVHASDFSNVSGVFITGAGAQGAGAGIVNVRSTMRDVDASIKSSSLDVSHALNASGTAAAAAVSKQSLTTFAIAGAGGIGAGAAVVEVDVQRGETTAVIDGVTGSVGALGTTADHFTRVGQIDIAGSGGAGAGALMVSVGVDKGQTAAHVRNASLDVTGGNVIIDARNRIKGYNVTVTASGGVGAGTIGVGVNHGSAQVDASLLNSDLGTASQRAGSVYIGAHNTADLLTVAATATGGVGAGCILVNVDNLYSDVGVNVSNSHVYAQNITISADEDYKLRAHAWGASGGVGAGLIYVQVLNVGEDEPFSDPDYDSQLSDVSASKDAALDKAQKYVSGESGGVNSSVLTPKEAQLVRDARSNDADIRQSESSTLHISVGETSLLDASENISIAGVESTDVISYQGGFTGGVGAGAVNLGFMSVRKQAGVTIDTSKLNAGGTLSVSSTLNGHNDQHIIQGIGGGGVAFAAYGRLTAKGAATVTAKSSDLSGAQGVSLSALDTAINESYGAGGTLAGVPVGGIVARTITDSTVRVTFDGGNVQSTGGTVAFDARRTGETYAQEVFGYIGGVSGLGADAKASESTNVSVVAGSADRAAVVAKKFAVHSELNPYVHANVYQEGGSALVSVGVPLAEAVLDGGSAVTLGAQNSYSVPEISVESFVGGEDDALRMNSFVSSYGGTILGVDYQYTRSEVTNDASATIDMQGGSFDADTLSALALHALNNAGISADVETLRAGVTVASMNNAAKVYNYGKASVTMTNSSEQPLASMDVKAESISDTRAKTNGDGGGAVYIDDASSSSGGAKAAWAYTDIQNAASVDIAGEWKTSDDLNVSASQTAKMTDWSDAVIGGAITINGTQHDLNLTGNASVAVAENAGLISGGAMKLEARNAIEDNPNNDYTSSGNSYGAVSGNGTKNIATITQNATVTIAADASLSSNAAMSLLAHSNSNVNEYARIVSGGVGAGSDAVNEFTATWNNSISIAGGAKLSTGSEAGDVTLAAWDNGNLQVTALGDMQGGVVGGATSKLTVTLNRTNAVSLAGSIESARDANLWAGLDSAGDKASLTLNAISHAYAHGAITGASASLSQTINQNNTVTIDGSVRTIRHVNITAKTGDLNSISSAERYAWTSSKKTGDVSSTALGDSVSGLNEDNSVSVTGSVAAGVNNRFIMNVSDGFALLDDESLEMIQYDADGKLYVKVDVTSAEVPVMSGDQQTGTTIRYDIDHYRQGTSDDYDFAFDLDLGSGKKAVPVISIDQGNGVWRLGQIDNYASYLYERKEALETLMEDYAGDQKSAAYLAFQSELQMINDTLASYGLPSDRNAGSDRNVFLVVPFVEVGPVTVSGGNITIDTPKLTGSGTLNANGAPEITVRNESNMALKLNGLNILSPGGEVIVNTFSVKDTADMQSRVTAASGFSGVVSADAKSDKTAAVTVENTWSRASVSVDITSATSPDVPLASRFSVVSDIENTKDIVNYPGTVKLSTKIGSIRSVSADIIGGKGVTLEAPRGAISITSTGILNVDGAPETVFETLIRRYVGAYADDGRTVTSHDVGVSAATLVKLLSENEGLGFESLGHIVAGGNVYITAGTIDVNGVIQSGFGRYGLSLLSDRLSPMIASYDEGWDGTTIYPDDPNELSAFPLVSDDMAWDPTDHAYSKIPNAWYNPSTKKIVVEDMVGAGGTVYLTGQIVNTNIWDGFTDSDFAEYDTLRTDAMPTAAQLMEHRSRVIAYAGAAEIEIVSDLDRTIRLGEIDTGDRQGRIVISDVLKSGDQTTVTEGTIPYQPQTGARYNVSGGSKETDTTKYTESQSFSWWSDGWKDSRDTSKSAESAGEQTTSLDQGATTALLDDLMHQNGYGDASADALLWVFTDKVTTQDAWTDWTYDVHYNNWTHFSGTITRTQLETHASQQTVLVSLKADNPIEVGVRQAANAGQITITAPSADVELSGTVKSTVNGVSVDITARDIIAGVGASVNSDIVVLNAAGNIGSGDAPLVLLSPGDDIAVTAVAGGDMWLNAAGASAQIDLIGTGENSVVSLTAEGHVNGKAEAPNVALISERGSIGAADSALTIAGTGRTTLSADAYGSAFITKTDGDLAINSVKAGENVTLTTQNGSIVDADPDTEKKDLSNEDLIALWKKAGLISNDESGSNISDEQREKNVANLENIMRSKYSAYQSIVKKLDDESTTPEQREYLEKQLANLSEYSDVTDIEAYISEQKTTEGTDLYNLTNADKTGWTQAYLLYSIQDAILNPSAGSVQSTAREIIVGKTVTLDSHVNIGSVDQEETIKGGAALLDNDMAGLKKLSQASPADVTWFDDDAGGRFVIQNAYEVGLTADETTATAPGVVLLASPKHDLVVKSVVSTGGGKIHLMAAGNVLLSANAPTDTAAVRGGDLFIAAAGESVDIGAADRPVTIEQRAGTELRANAGRSVYLTAHSGDLTLGSMAARKDLYVTTTQEGANILMGEGEGRLNAENVRLTVNAGDVGSSERAVRVQNAESNDFSKSVAVSGAKNVWLSGENGTLEEGWLNVNGLNAENASVQSEGSLYLSGDTEVTGAGIFTAADDFISGGKLTGGIFVVTAAGGAAKIGGAVSADELFVTAHDTIELTSPLSVADEIALVSTAGGVAIGQSVRTGVFSAMAGDSITVLDVEAGNVDMTASNDVTVNGKLIGGELTLTAGENVNVSGETSGDAVTITSGADTTLADVKAKTLEASAGGSLTTANVRANAAELTASNDVTVNGKLTGNELTLTAGENVTVSGETNADTLKVSAGKDATFARVRVPEASVSAGGTALLNDRGNDMDTLNLSAASADVYDVNELTLNVARIGDLNAETVGDMTVSFAQRAGNVSLTSSGGTVDLATEVRANNLAVAAKDSLSVVHPVETTNTASFASSGDILIASGVRSGTLITESEGFTRVTGTIETTDLTMTAGGQIRLTENVHASGDISLTSRRSSVSIEEEIRARSLRVAAKDAITATRNITVTNDTLLNSSHDIVIDGTLQSGNLTTTSGGDTTFGGKVRTGDLHATAGGDLTAKDTLEASGSLTAIADGTISLNGNASAAGDLYLTGYEISVRNLMAGKFLTALSDTTFAGNDLTAGSDLRVHTYGDMTFNDATAGGNAWILGLGSSAARLKFHHVKADGRDTAVLLERGYLDFWRVTAGLDGAVGVRYFEGPRLAGQLVQGSKIRVYFPYGGSLMPKDPFNFHVVDLLKNSDLVPYILDVVRMWPPRREPDLRAGSADIEVDPGDDDYKYWLPEEALSVSERQ